MVMRQLFSLAVLALAASIAQAQFRVADIQPCQGPLGPAREPVYDLGDDVFIRYRILGAKPNSEKSISVDIQLDILGPDGKKVDHISGTVKCAQVFADESPQQFFFSIRRTWVPGEYLQKVTLKDNESGAETSFTQKFTVLPERLAILPAQFFYDEIAVGVEGKKPAPNGGLVGQTIYYKSWVVGLDTSKGISDIEIAMELRDSKGQKVLCPIFKRRQTEDPEITKNGSFTFGGSIPLGAPGDFLLHAVATDHIAGKSVACDFPLHIEAPGKGMRYESGSREVPTPPGVISTPPPLIQVSSPPK